MCLFCQPLSDEQDGKFPTRFQDSKKGMVQNKIKLFMQKIPSCKLFVHYTGFHLKFTSFSQALFFTVLGWLEQSHQQRRLQKVIHQSSAKTTSEEELMCCHAIISLKLGIASVLPISKQLGEKTPVKFRSEYHDC